MTMYSFVLVTIPWLLLTTFNTLLLIFMVSIYNIINQIDEKMIMHINNNVSFCLNYDAYAPCNHYQHLVINL